MGNPQQPVNQPEKLVPEECFLCHTPVHEIEEGQFACDHCKRIWVRGNGQWETIARKVQLLKEPEVGDELDDVIKPLPPEE